jgi:hypothetical protein
VTIGGYWIDNCVYWITMYTVGSLSMLLDAPVLAGWSENRAAGVRRALSLLLLVGASSLGGDAAAPW